MPEQLKNNEPFDPEDAIEQGAQENGPGIKDRAQDLYDSGRDKYDQAKEMRDKWKGRKDKLSQKVGEDGAKDLGKAGAKEAGKELGKEAGKELGKEAGKEVGKKAAQAGVEGAASSTGVGVALAAAMEVIDKGAKLAEKVTGQKITMPKVLLMIMGSCLVGFIIIIMGLSMLFSFMVGDSHGDTGSGIAGVLDIPYMNQFRDDPDNCYGGSEWNGAQSPPGGGMNGCGGTSQAMVENFIKKDGTTLETIYERRCADGNCSNRFDLPELNQQISSSGIQYSRKTFSGGENPGDAETEEALNTIKGSIEKGYPAVIHVLPPFAASQHIMLVTGFASNGDVYINDPNCGRDAPPFLELGTPQGKNNLASRQELKEAMRAWYEYVE
jgi:hypothetical protein